MVCLFVTKPRVSAVRSYLCTLAVAMSLNAWCRVPRDAFRYGGLAYALALSVAGLVVATPAALLQLALGQLCQQGVVGMWRAVPFFTGVGYLRLLITSLSSVYTIIHLALFTTNFFYNLSTQGILRECTEFEFSKKFSEATSINSTVLCVTDPLMAGEEPEYYTAVALLITSFWILLPFLLFNPVKFMKRIFYVLGPLVLILGIVIVSCLGVWEDLLSIYKRGDWPNFLTPGIWHAALIQALVSAQVAGGYLVSVGDTLYSNDNIQWTTVTLVGANIASSWLGAVFWYAISGSSDKDTSPMAVIYQVYYLTEEKHLTRAWPLLIFFTLALSGIITMVLLLYPVYDRLRVVGGLRWRMLSAASSALGAAAALVTLAWHHAALRLLDDLALPLLISLTTVLEISAFLFIYGWKILVEDIEFLMGKPLSRYWVFGWCVSVGVLAPFSAWWVAITVMEASWSEPPYSASAVAAAAALALLVLLVCATGAVAKQVQYDFITKLKSSFTPSRHWGPRDPITHYYWVMQRAEAERGGGGEASRYHRRRQLSVLAPRAPPVPPMPPGIDSPNPLAGTTAAETPTTGSTPCTEDKNYP